MNRKIKSNLLKGHKELYRSDKKKILRLFVDHVAKVSIFLFGYPSSGQAHSFPHT